MKPIPNPPLVPSLVPTLSLYCTQLTETQKSRGGQIRTDDFLLPKQALYQAELRPVMPTLAGSYHRGLLAWRKRNSPILKESWRAGRPGWHMITLRAFFFLGSFLALAAASRAEPYAEPDYAKPPEGEAAAGVPEGRIQRFTFVSKGGVFPGTVRRYWVYVPQQYEASRPAALMVFQDGHAYVDRQGQFRAPTVMDHLIAKGEMPVTLGVFVNPGVFGEALPEGDGWEAAKGLRSHRSEEYDTPSPAYASFLEQELLPEIAKTWSFSADPAQRAIAGISSGGICAFTAAWERPDLFRKVMSHVGSFTDIRGGYIYPALIRRTEPAKPLRVFLQDGARDLDNKFGNWPLANQQMANSLAFMKYDYQFIFSPDSAHSGKFGGSILPDSLRWLWRK